MQPAQRKLPLQAIELYDDFIHGQITRRVFMEGDCKSQVVTKGEMSESPEISFSCGCAESRARFSPLDPEDLSLGDLDA